MPFELVRNDIVRMPVDAIVNAANSGLRPGGGVCGAIFAAAGFRRLNEACCSIGHCDVGGAVITPGFDLPAKFVIHAVGPIWRGGFFHEAELLRSAYLNSLTLAEENGCQSIAFPLISSGIYGYPKEEAFRIAVTAIQDFLMEHEMQVYLILFGRGAVAVGKKVFADIQSYIDDHYVEVHYPRRSFFERRIERKKQLEEQTLYEEAFTEQRISPSAAPEPCYSASPFEPKDSLEALLSHMEDTFSTHLFRLIDKREMTDVEVYKRANIDRKLFSKLRKEGYTPSKQTVLALTIALRLSLDECRDLLCRAGYALSPSNKADVIIQYFIEREIYDIFAVNEALFSFGEKVLGS